VDSIKAHKQRTPTGISEAHRPRRAIAQYVAVKRGRVGILRRHTVASLKGRRLALKVLLVGPAIS